ncbi:MAG: ROK family protein [Spirochaeta sp.]
MSVSKPDEHAARTLSSLFCRPGLSRAGLADTLMIDRGMVTRVVQNLLDQGVLQEGLPVTGTGSGRRPVALYLNDRDRCILGLEVQREYIKVGWVTPYGDMLDTDVYHSAGAESGKNTHPLLARIIGVIDAEIERLSTRGYTATAIGIALTGLIDPHSGQVLFSPYLGVQDQPLNLQNPLEAAYNLPVSLDNDARCCCYDVMTYGALQHRQNFLYIFGEFKDDAHSSRYTRVGVGTSLVLNGQVQYGTNGAAGEFRSIFSDPGKPGQFGNDNIYCGIKTRRDLRTEFFRELFRHTGFLANYLDLEAVHLGGGIAEYREEAEPILQSAITENWLYRDIFPKKVSIRFAQSDEKPALRGAAALAARGIFLETR